MAELTAAPIREHCGRDATLRRLPNGATVVALYRPTAMNDTVTLSIGAGMRDELPGEEGMMHLIEHMVYQDSNTISGTTRQRDVARAGATLGGHTHMDYTEFFETGSTEGLQIVAQRLVDQVFFPAFVEQQVEEQIVAVATERQQRLAPTPGQRLPWPHLSGMYWADHANGHDGSGDMGLRGRATVEALRALHQRTYRVSDAVLVAQTAQAPQATLETLAATLAPIRTPAGQPQPPRPAATVADAVARHAEVIGGNKPRSIAVTQLSPATHITQELLGELLVAELLAIQPDLDASAGLFGPADLNEHDLLVIVDDSGLVVQPQDRISALRAAGQELICYAATRAAFRAEGLIRHDEKRVRTVARDVLLRGSVTFAGELVEPLIELADAPDDAQQMLASTCLRLSNQPYATLTIT